MRWWTTTWVRHFIATRFGRENGRERVRQLLHELGFRLRRLRHRHLKAKPEAPSAFPAELEALVADWSEEWALIVVAEATVRRHPTLTAQWCVVDEVPAVPSGDDQTKGPVDGAVAPLAGRTPSQISPEVGTGEFAPFLQHFLVYHPGKQLPVFSANTGVNPP